MGQMPGEGLIMAEWFGLIGSEPLHRGQLLWGFEWWSVQRPGNASPCRQPPPNKSIKQTLLILYPSVILHFDPFSGSLSVSPALPLSLSHIYSSFLSFFFFVLPHASGCWIIDGMLSWREFSCCGLVGRGLCCFFFLLSRCVRVCVNRRVDGARL